METFLKPQLHLKAFRDFVSWVVEVEGALGAATLGAAGPALRGLLWRWGRGSNLKKGRLNTAARPRLWLDGLHWLC